MKVKNTQITFLSIIIIAMFMAVRFFNPDSSWTSEDTLDYSVEVRNPDFQKVFVTKVIDGDTAWVEIEGDEKKVRFIGVNSPEKGEKNYQEATDFTKSIILNQWVYLEKDISDTDQYDRLLRYIWLDVPQMDSDEERREKMLNSMLIEAGLAEIVVFKPDIKYLEFFRSINEQ